MRISNGITIMEQRKADIMADYASAVAFVGNATSVAMLRQSDSRLNRLSQLQLPEKNMQEILDIQAHIAEAIKCIEALPYDNEALAQVISSATPKTNKYCYLAIKQCAMDFREKLEKEEGKWLLKYIDTAEQTYSTMTLQECTIWLDKTSTPPPYLRYESINRYQKAKCLVEARLHNARVDGVLYMYNRLSDEEKKDFLKRIHHP